MVLLVSCLLFSSVVLAEKPVESPRFKSGVMGEIFQQLGASGQSVITPGDLVGEWICNSFAKKSTHPIIDDNWVLGIEGFYLEYLEGTIIFNDDGDGSFSITLPNQDPFYLITTDTTVTPTYIIIADTLYRKCYYFINGESRSSIVSFNIKRITQNIIIFKLLDGPQFVSKVVICQRVLTP